MRNRSRNVGLAALLAGPRGHGVVQQRIPGRPGTGAHRRHPAARGRGSCDDDPGDILSTPPTGRSTSGRPRASTRRLSAKVDGDKLAIEFTTAGPVESLDDPTFFVEHGSGASTDASFELRIQPMTAAPARTWGTLLVTFKAGNQQPSSRLAAPVTVTDTGVRVDVPSKDLPPIVALVWSFGVSNGEGPDALSDDCSTVDPPRTGGSTPGTVTPPSTAPPTTSAPIPFGQTQVYKPTGSKVTVYAAQFPPVKSKPLSTPLEDGSAPAVADVQVCVGDKATEVRSTSFQLKGADNRLYFVYGLPESATDPAFPASQALQPGECIRGWVTFPIPVDAEVAAHDDAPDTRNYLALEGLTGLDDVVGPLGQRAERIACHTFSAVAGMSRRRTPEAGERVDDRVVHGGGGPDGAGLADALGPESDRGGGLHGEALERGELRGRDHPVVGEVRRERVAVVVEADLFEQGLGGSLGEPTVHLALGEKGVEDGAGVVDRHEPHELDPAGLGVDLDHGHVRAEGRSAPPQKVESPISGVSGWAAATSDHPTPTAGVPATWNRASAMVPGAAPSRWPAVSAGPGVRSTMSSTAASSRSAACSRPRSMAWAAASCTAAPGELHRAGAAGDRPAGDDVGVAVHDHDAVHRDAQPVGREHGPRRVVALAVGVSSRW